MPSSAKKKLPETLLTNYHRWTFEKGKEQSVEALLERVTREAEQSVASEPIHGLTSSTSSMSTGSNPGSVPATNPRHTHRRSNFSVVDGCAVCTVTSHGLAACEVFQRMTEVELGGRKASGSLFSLPWARPSQLHMHAQLVLRS